MPNCIRRRRGRAAKNSRTNSRYNKKTDTYNCKSLRCRNVMTFCLAQSRLCVKCDHEERRGESPRWAATTVDDNARLLQKFTLVCPIANLFFPVAQQQTHCFLIVSFRPSTIWQTVCAYSQNINKTNLKVEKYTHNYTQERYVEHSKAQSRFCLPLSPLFP